MALTQTDRVETGRQSFPQVLIQACLLLGSLAVLGLTIHDGPGTRPIFVHLAQYFLWRQDLPVALAMVLILAAARFVAPPADEPRLALEPWMVCAILLGMALAAWFLRSALFDYDLTRDEQMVAFDARIYGSGRLFAPFPSQWREWYAALNTNFIFPIGDREGWVSSYLPGNAALHALLEHILPASAVSPLLLAVAGLSLWRIARRFWPESPGTQAVVLLLFAGSSQALLMATSSYAMVAHLTANMIWLWLFLQRRPVAQAGAIAVGFVATGLHQTLFHPIFVLPFLDVLRRERRWRELSVYLLAYAAIGLFWLAWPGWIGSHALHPTPPEFRIEGVGYVERVHKLLAAGMTTGSLGLMAANLLRFFTWQHLLLAPLLLAGVRFAWRDEPLCRALATGMILLVAAMLVLLPAQAHGWGYRYLHGFLGSAVLVAGFGWRKLELAGRAPASIVIVTSALSILLLLPLHALMARNMIASSAHASATLNRIPADVVIVDDWWTPFGPDLVVNRPDLSNRPILLQSSLVPVDSIAHLCANRRSVAFADATLFGQIDSLYGMVDAPSAGEHQALLQAAARAAGCRAVSVSQILPSSAAMAGQE